jgi:hypothetical protein
LTYCKAIRSRSAARAIPCRNVCVGSGRTFCSGTSPSLPEFAPSS